MAECYDSDDEDSSIGSIIDDDSEPFLVDGTVQCAGSIPHDVIPNLKESASNSISNDEIEHPMIIDDQVLVKQEQLEHSEVLENVVENTKNVLESDENAASISDEIEQPMIIDDRVLVKEEILDQTDDMIIDHGQVPGVKQEFLDVLEQNYKSDEQISESENQIDQKPIVPIQVDIDEDQNVEDFNPFDHPGDQVLEQDPLVQQFFSKLPDPWNYIRKCLKQKRHFWQCLLCFNSKWLKCDILKHVNTHQSCDQCGKCWSGIISAKMLKNHLIICPKTKILGVQEKIRPKVLKRKCPFVIPEQLGHDPLEQPEHPGIKIEQLEQFEQSEQLGQLEDDPLVQPEHPGIKIEQFEQSEQLGQLGDDLEHPGFKIEQFEQLEQLEYDPLERHDQQPGAKIEDPQKYVRQTDNGQEWQCLLCFYQRPNRKWLVTHVKTHISCEKCGRNWAGKRALGLLKSHFKVCKGPKQTNCHFCGKEYRNSRDIRIHIKHCRHRPSKLVTKKPNMADTKLPMTDNINKNSNEEEIWVKNFKNVQSRRDEI
jgi:hypothetical protein